MEEMNNKQNVSIAEIRKDCEWMRKEIDCIRLQVFNHIPTSISELTKDIQKIKDNITFGFIIGIASIIIIQVLLKLFS